MEEVHEQLYYYNFLPNPERTPLISFQNVLFSSELSHGFSIMQNITSINTVLVIYKKSYNSLPSLSILKAEAIYLTVLPVSSCITLDTSLVIQFFLVCSVLLKVPKRKQ